MVTLPPRPDEVEAAAQYLVGTSGMRVATQSGLADALADLLFRGLEVSWMRDHPADLMRVSPEDVREAARTVFAPTRLVWTVLGDADVLHHPLSQLTPVTTLGDA
jgi:predicted Zn-dependent peptidase